jgi:hypothetical protein
MRVHFQNFFLFAITYKISGELCIIKDADGIKFRVDI